MYKIKIAYFGTPYFSARFLEKIITDAPVNQLTEIKFIVTQPDKPVGRKQTITKSPVKEIAEKYRIELFDIENSNIENSLKIVYPEKFQRNLFGENFKLKIKECDLALVFAYSQIIPKEFLDIPKYGFWCIHPSLLPQYRGASPIAFPILLGDKKTGVTIFKMDEKIDHGPIIAQEAIKINQNDRRPDLETKLTSLGYRLFKNVILNLFQDLDSGPIKISEDFQGKQARMTFEPQNHKNATFTRMLTKEDGFIPLSTLTKSLKNEPLTIKELPELIKKLEIRNSSKIIYNYFRGMYPWPGLWTLIKIKGKEKRLKITELSLQPTTHNLQSINVQLEGKNEVDFETFNKAYKIFTL